MLATTIANLGQRQAILHDVSTALGIYRDSGTPALIPLAKRDLEDGEWRYLYCHKIEINRKSD